jgi:hypothetical protein
MENFTERAENQVPWQPDWNNMSEEELEVRAWKETGTDDITYDATVVARENENVV